MKQLKNTNVVTVSQEYWIANEDERASAKLIIWMAGYCHGIHCCQCPLNDTHDGCVESHSVRVEICKKMLEK